MSLIDIIFWGWYQILDKTIYLFRTEKGAFGAKEHSFFITFLFHGINFWTILSYLVATYFNGRIPLYCSIALSILIFAIGYLIYFRRKRVDKVVSYQATNTKGILFLIVSVVYAIISVYFMFGVGDYLRTKVAL